MASYEIITRENYGEIARSMQTSGGILAFGNENPQRASSLFDFYTNLEGAIIIPNNPRPESGLLFGLSPSNLDYANRWVLGRPKSFKKESRGLVRLGGKLELYKGRIRRKELARVIDIPQQRAVYLSDEECFQDAVAFALSEEVSRLDRIITHGIGSPGIRQGDIERAVHYVIQTKDVFFPVSR